MKIVFMGDSITDAGRDRSDHHNLGNGYVKVVAQLLEKEYPDIDFEFINVGISGNKAEEIKLRIDKDGVDLKPDIFVIMVGINETLHFSDKPNWMPDEHFENCYREVLESIKTNTKAKIIMMEQFLLYRDLQAYFRADLNPKIDITRSLAREYADIFVPLDGLFAAASIKKAPTDWANDGIHPTPEGAAFIANHLLEAIKEVI